MSRYLFKSHYLILLFVVVVVLCSTLFVSGNASNAAVETGEQEKLSVDLYELKKEITNIKNPSGTADSSSSTKITFCQIRSHFFLFAAKNGLIVAVTEAEYKENNGNGECSTVGEKKVDVVAKFIEADNDNLKKDDIKGTAESWKTQLATEKNYGKIAVSATEVFAVNSDKDKIKIFLVNIKNNNEEWEFKLVEGTISGEQKGKPITWTTNDLNGLDDGQDSQAKLKEYKIKSFVAESSAFFTKNKKIVFVVKGESAETDKKNVVAVFQYEEAKKLTLVHHEKTKNGYPTFFKWGEEVFMIPTDDSEKNKGKLIMFNTGEGQKFTETNNSFVRLHNVLKDKNNFVTATTENNGSFLLFTQEKKEDSNNDKKKRLLVDD